MKGMSIQECFKKAVENHSISIRMDNGVYRHIVCSNNGHWNQRFDIVTYPGYLVVSGGMDAWVFTRTKDMFEFFRRKDDSINPCYWAETCRAGKTTEYSEENSGQYTHHFLWALHAIVWAINRYDSEQGKKS